MYVIIMCYSSNDALYIDSIRIDVHRAFDLDLVYVGAIVQWYKISYVRVCPVLLTKIRKFTVVTGVCTINSQIPE